MGGNIVGLSYDSDSDDFVAETQPDDTTPNVTWTAMGVQLRDPNGNLAGDMAQDPTDENKWEINVPNPAPGTWTAVADFEGSDQETGTHIVS